MRWVLAVLAIVAFAVMPVYAVTYSVDGSVSEWVTGVDAWMGPIQYNAGGTFQMNRYGAIVDSGTLYAFVELSAPVGIPGGSPSGNSYPAVYIDIDANAGTKLGNLTGYVPPGTDINVELDNDTGAIPTGGGPGGGHVNFWGHGNDWANGSADAVGATFARSADQTVFEWSCPVSKITAEVANCDGAIPLPSNQWVLYVGGEAAPHYGRHVGLVPEPGTIAMLIGAGLALVGYALRRR
jgi:hypothetical protein